jgi:hypothetical protein
MRSGFRIFLRATGLLILIKSLSQSARVEPAKRIATMQGGILKLKNQECISMSRLGGRPSLKNQVNPVRPGRWNKIQNSNHPEKIRARGFASQKPATQQRKLLKFQFLGI